MRRRLLDAAPALLIVIDFPEFNLALAAVAKRRGIPVLYYISPQVWAWRRGRVHKIARRVDRLAVGSSSKITCGCRAKAEATSKSFLSPWERFPALL